jgi:hypothetical protein
MSTMGPIGDEPPVDVSQLAQTRGFGPRVASRALASPLVTGGLGLVAAAACVGLLMLFGALHPPRTGLLYPVMRFIALFLCFSLVGALVFSIRAFVRGAQAFHVYAGGFIHRRNGKARAFGWPEVGELRPVYGKRGDTAGKLLHYQLVPRTGAPVAIPLHLVDGRDAFMDQFMAVLDRNGIPVS